MKKVLSLFLILIMLFTLTPTIAFGGTSKSISSYTITLSNNSVIYSGNAKKPTVSIKGLTQGKDFSVSYSNNVNAGTGKIIIKGIGIYTGTVTKTFKIEQKTIAGSGISIVQSTNNCSPKYTIKYTFKSTNGKTYVRNLVEGTDYTITYQHANPTIGSGQNCCYPGTSYAIITGKGNYRGTVKKSYKEMSRLWQHTQYTCSVTSTAMVINYLSGTNYTDYTDSLWNYLGVTTKNKRLTKPEGIKTAIKNYCSGKYSDLKYYSSSAAGKTVLSAEKIRQFLRDGYVVIVAVNGYYYNTHGTRFNNGNGYTTTKYGHLFVLAGVETKNGVEGVHVHDTMSSCFTDYNTTMVNKILNNVHVAIAVKKK